MLFHNRKNKKTEYDVLIKNCCRRFINEKKRSSFNCTFELTYVRLTVHYNVNIMSPFYVVLNRIEVPYFTFHKILSHKFRTS